MKKLIEKIKQLDKGTICRTILQFAAYANQIIAVIGYGSFAASPVYQWITFAFTLIVTAVTFWYNNDFTNIAILCGDIFEMMKDGKITQEEVKKFIEKYKKKEVKEKEATSAKKE